MTTVYEDPKAVAEILRSAVTSAVEFKQTQVVVNPKLLTAAAAMLEQRDATVDADAARAVVNAFNKWMEATNPLSAARAITELANAISDLESWLPDEEPSDG